jgi:hypothetical protein
MRMFGRLLLPWLLGLIFIVSCSATSNSTAGDNIQPQPPKAGVGVSLRVLWTVSEYRLGTNAVWGDEEARKLLFQPLDITAASITFNGKTCHDVTFKKEQVKAKEYLANAYNTTPQTLGITDETVDVIKTNCTLPGFAEYMRLKYGRLVIQINGVFFYLAPAVNY